MLLKIESFSYFKVMNYIFYAEYTLNCFLGNVITRGQCQYVSNAKFMNILGAYSTSLRKRSLIWNSATSYFVLVYQRKYTMHNIQYPSISAKTSSVFAKLLSHLCK